MFKYYKIKSRYNVKKQRKEQSIKHKDNNNLQNNKKGG